MCESQSVIHRKGVSSKTVPVDKAVGMVLPHDITEIRPGEFKGRAFKKGHIVRDEDIEHLKRLGKEHLYILEIQEDEMHENDAALAMAKALAGHGVAMAGEPNEGKINLVAEKSGLLKVHHTALTDFNMLGEVMCATVHNNTVVNKGETVAGTRAIPLVVRKSMVSEAVKIAENARGVLSIKEIRKPKAGIVITGNEVYNGKIKDAFEPVIRKKIQGVDGDIIGVHFAPDDAEFITNKIVELISAGADLIITTGGMSVDPDDVTRFAIRDLGVEELYYGSPVLPGAMFLIAYISAEAGKCGSAKELKRENAEARKYQSVEENKSVPYELTNLRADELIPVLGIPACGMYACITVFDLVLPRVLAGEKIGRRELAELGHGGLCLKCSECRYPVCPFGK
ncbi:MAG: molybdopterin-binding protein [Nitrospira bacterium SG8_35_4]|nr:MAG: molybdopterin-binding protein [Nitrospira bacterium SG8_35_4]